MSLHPLQGRFALCFPLRTPRGIVSIPRPTSEEGAAGRFTYPLSSRPIMTDSFARSTRGARDARSWGLTRRAWFKASGFDDIDLAKPVIGIAQTWSELNHCHIHFRELAEAVKRGVWQAGGWPPAFPTIPPGAVHTGPPPM